MGNKLLIGLVLFYTCFFGLLGTVPQSDITTNIDVITYNESGGVAYNSVETVNNVSGVYEQNQVFEDYAWASYITNFIDNIFVNVSGLPSLLNVLVFAPLVIFAAYWLIIFLLKFVPWLG